MGSSPHSSTHERAGVGTTPGQGGLGTTPGQDVGTTVYTDGACSGNPGPGGWAWVEPDGEWAGGYDPGTTNQRMELTAVLRACEHFDGPLRIVSDSTYVVNCWRDGWWRGWLKRGWLNSRKEPVANRDLWEGLVPHFRDRSGFEMAWVKGHSGDRWNDLADRLAVGAVQRREGCAGQGDPPDDVLGSEDRAGYVAASTPGSDGPGEKAPYGPDPLPVDTLPVDPMIDAGRSARRRVADPRVPDGYLVAVGGLGGAAAQSDAIAEQLATVLAAQAALHPELVVLTGLRRGAETAAAIAASGADVPYVAVLPYPDPTAGWPEQEAAEFQRLLDRARAVTTLERKRPTDLEGRRKSLSRRDGWLRSAADAAVLLTDGSDAEAEDALRRWEAALGADVWRLDV